MKEVYDEKEVYDAPMNKQNKFSSESSEEVLACG